jgi:hypothetical protein
MRVYLSSVPSVHPKDTSYRTEVRFNSPLMVQPSCAYTPSDFSAPALKAIAFYSTDSY